MPRIEAALAKQSAQLQSEGKDTEAVRLEDAASRVLEALREHQYVRGLEYFLPYLYDEPTTVLDYLPAGATVVIDEPTHLHDEYHRYLKDMTEISLARLDQGLLLPLPAPLHLPLEAMQPALAQHPVLELSLLGVAGERPADLVVTAVGRPVEHAAGDMERFAKDLQKRQKAGERVLIASRQVDRLVEILDEMGIGGPGA